MANDRISHKTSNCLRQVYLKFYHTLFFLNIIIFNYEVLEKIVYLFQKQIVSNISRNIITVTYERVLYNTYCENIVDGSPMKVKLCTN